VAGVKFSDSAPVPQFLNPVSSEISALLLFVSYFASQSKVIKFGVCFFDECCANYNFLVTCQILTASFKNIGPRLKPQLSSFSNLTPTLTKHTYLNNKPQGLIISFLSVFDMQNMTPVLCKGGTNGATAPGIQGRGHPKSEIAKI